MSGGRPENIQIDSNDPEIAALIDHLNQVVLNGKNTIKEKAKELSRIATERKYYLAAVYLERNLFSPYKEGKPIALSRKYIKTLNDLLRDLRKEKDGYNINIEIVSKFKEKYLPDELIKTKSSTEQEDIFAMLFKSRPPLKHLAGTEWILFERFGDAPIKNAEWGIAIGRIKFTISKNYLHVSMQTVYKGVIRNYRGIATYDTQKCLFLDLLKIGDENRSNFILQMTDSDVLAQSILIGHYSFYSSSTAYNHILSKTVVLKKILEDSNDTTKAEYLPIGSYAPMSKEYKLIPQEIRSFLYTRELNRMGMPREKISNLSDLKEFLDVHRDYKKNPVLKKHFQGEYKVYYKRSDNVIVEDIVQIYNDDDAIKLMVKYIHRPDQKKEHNKVWLGQISLNNTIASVELSNEKSKIRPEPEDPILLTFHLPPIDTYTFKVSQCFPGIISGLEDGFKGPIGFVCLAVRDGIDGFKGVDDDRIKNYFQLHTSWMIQPKEKKFMLNDINEN